MSTDYKDGRGSTKNLEAVADLVMQYERWRDASPQDRLDPATGPEIQIDIYAWAEKAAAALARMLEREDSTPFATFPAKPGPLPDLEAS